jgi:phosphatidylglycerol:prolipoprotein diacylglycerol transferase
VIPYFAQSVFSLGPLTIHAFGVCAAAALLTGYLLVDRRAHRYALDSTRASQVYVLLVVAGLSAGFLWNRMGGEPGISGSGSVLGCLVCVALVAWIARPGKASFWNTQDLYLFALPFVLTIARVGCFLAHDHIGKRTGAWIGVRFPGGTRFDLGLLYAISAASTAAVALWANRKTPPAGVVSLIVIALLSLSRLATLPLGPAKAADYVIAIGAPLFAGALWLMSRMAGAETTVAG